MKRAERRQIARLFLAFALVILVGCLLETYGGLRPISDAVRTVLYRKGVYENDLRDLLFYNRVRPKFFASEPASVTFCYTLFSFIWLVASPWRWKLPFYLVLVGLGLFAMPGPTLLLMLVLLLPYMLFLDSRRRGRIDATRFLVVAMVAALFALMALLLAKTLFAERLENGDLRQRSQLLLPGAGPGAGRVGHHGPLPFAGAGLTGEPFIEREITNLYLRSPYYSAGWQVVTPSTELLINYFWLHWIYLGFVWGVVLIAVISSMAARPRRPQRRLLLGHVGDPGPGLRRLCRPDLLGRAVPGRRRGPPASARRRRRGRTLAAPAGRMARGVRARRAGVANRGSPSENRSALKRQSPAAAIADDLRARDRGRAVGGHLDRLLFRQAPARGGHDNARRAISKDARHLQSKAKL